MMAAVIQTEDWPVPAALVFMMRQSPVLKIPQSCVLDFSIVGLLFMLISCRELFFKIVQTGLSQPEQTMNNLKALTMLS